LKFVSTPLAGAQLIEIEKLSDNRGFFGRAFGAREFAAEGLADRFVECSVSFNARKGTLRGMHFQKAPHAETKLVRVTRGSIYDVVIDLRPDSPTFKQWFGVTLSADAHRQLLVPEGFAHGFITQEDDTEIHYMISQVFAPTAATGVRYNDPQFNIRWPTEPVVVSDKDRAWPDFEG
jgi:dTDP-4-dehydrorhamnose 3,5-epimerase